MGTIIVTGSSGFIGGNLINFLNKKNIETVGISRRESPYNTNGFNIKYMDLTVDDNIDLLYEIKNVYALVHCAGESTNDSNCLNTLYFNIKSTSLLLKYAIENNIPKFIYLSSKKVLVDELYFNAYSLSKKICEDMIRYCNHKYSKNYHSLRLCNIYGKDKVITRIIPFIMECIISNKAIKTKSSLLEEIEFCSVDEVVNTIYLILMGESKSSDVMSIKYEFKISILELKNILLKLVSIIDNNSNLEGLSAVEYKLFPIVEFYCYLFKDKGF